MLGLSLRVGSGPVLEAPAFVPGLDDLAVMGEPVEKRDWRINRWITFEVPRISRKLRARSLS